MIIRFIMYKNEDFLKGELKMSQYNIEMNSFNGSSYDQLYPQTLINNISDWNSVIYSKEEINTTVLQNFQNSITVTQFNLLTTLEPRSKSFTIALPETISSYSTICFIFDEISTPSSVDFSVYMAGDIMEEIDTIRIGNGNAKYGILIFILDNYCMSFNSQGQSIKTSDLDYNNTSSNSFYINSSDSYSIRSGTLLVYGQKLKSN